MSNPLESIVESMYRWEFLNGKKPNKVKVRSDMLGRLAYEAFLSGARPNLENFQIKTLLGVPVEEMPNLDAPEWAVM